jgi:hypothetical protein
MEQSHSVFMPGLTRRGPVFNSTDGVRGLGSMPARRFPSQPFSLDYLGGPPMIQPSAPILNPAMLGALPALSPMVKYGLMAALLYLGVKRKIPFGLMGGAAAAGIVWQFFPDSASAGAAPITANVGPIDTTIPPLDISQMPLPSVGIPS